MTSSKATLAFVSLVAVACCFLTHEFTHWLMGELLGYDMVMTLNKGYPKALRWNSTKDFMVVSGVGPVIKLITALAAYSLILFTRNRFWVPFLFTCFYLEFLS
jgi:hypothetical protein